ncbi:hypothetical protein BST81_05010 [Leptolyngbya sp. 'hensonii']|uniref:serine/threonine protein kinase n=1 Tax=Leptolyngbya sp. 'hensonii' TaxID=1922337 RepID=UPI000959370E|nr:serine/threonine-protein kinase [Leptolyngbya sp. 'hensonii']OLP19620.1 hypothetical protein BST81_05010 [Leptolyngbya sp. 'hensonii']
MTLPLPQIASYRLIHLLYEGNRTLVYRGMGEFDRQPVVLKLLKQEHPSVSDMLRLRNHYTLTRRLHLSGVVRPLGLEPWGHRLVLVMPDHGDLSLRDYVQEHPLTLEEFLGIALQLAEILQELRQQRIIHKDIKPANILIQPETGQITLTDFGLASLLPQETQALKPPEELEGTLAYLSPEQTGRMNRGIDYRTDFYSLGVTFYELLTGQLPFPSQDPLDLVYCHLAKEPVPPHELIRRLESAVKPAIPETLSRMVLKLMAKNAEDRYQSPLGLKADLELCLDQYRTIGTIAHFIPGQVDDMAQFNIPQKLYGRESQVKTLLAAFERISQGGVSSCWSGGLLASAKRP